MGPSAIASVAQMIGGRRLVRQIPFIVALACLLPAISWGQGREATPAEALVSVSYSVCLSPTTPLRIAITEASKARFKDCKKWSTPERVSKALDLTPGAMGDVSVNAFLKDSIPGLYKVMPPTYVTRQLYQGFEKIGWQEIRAADERTGTFVVWPKMAGIVVSDRSTANERLRDPLAGLTVLYPSKARGGQLSVVDAKTLHASLGATPAPRFLFPSSPSGKTIFWNTWVESIAGDPVPGHILTATNSYNIALDLSRFDYAQVGHAGPGPPEPATKAYIDELVRRHKAIHVIATTVGRGLRFSDNRTVHERIVRPKSLEEPGSGRGVTQTIRAFATTASALSETVDGALDPIRIRVEAYEAGCSGIAFSVWNAPMTRLIDYVVRTVAIKRPDGTMPPCVPAADIAVWPDTPRLSLLSLESGRPTNASLHVFERTGSASTSTVVVYAQDDLQMPYSWSIPVRLSELERSLKRYLEHADSKVYLRDIGGVVRDHFFNAESEDDQTGQALKALAALDQLATRPPGKRTLFVRFANTANQAVFVPIHLLPIGDGQLLGTKIDVVHPFPPPVDLSATGADCLDSFNFVISPNVSKPLQAKQALDEIRTKLQFNVIDTWDGFVTYVKEPKPQTATEGLFVIAHHGPNEIAFDPAQHQPRVTSQTIFRRFRPGSVAVLVACSAASISETDTGRQILEKLNNRGVGAAVISPFLVDSEVGARLTAAFARRVADARSGPVDLTIGTVFRQAISDVLDKTISPGLGDLDRLRINEFMLVGNVDIRICRRGP
jgi:hypothetical protein